MRFQRDRAFSTQKFTEVGCLQQRTKEPKLNSIWYMYIYIYAYILYTQYVLYTHFSSPKFPALSRENRPEAMHMADVIMNWKQHRPLGKTLPSFKGQTGRRKTGRTKDGQKIQEEQQLVLHTNTFSYKGSYQEAGCFHTKMSKATT